MPSNKDGQFIATPPVAVQEKGANKSSSVLAKVAEVAQCCKNIAEPSAGMAGALWFAFSWGAAYLEWQDGSSDYYHNELFKKKLVPLFVGERLTVHQTVAGSIVTLSLLTLCSAICLSVTNKMYPKTISGVKCSCFCCTKSVLGCVANSTRLVNYIVGNPGYWWAHVDMALTCAGTNYRHEPEAHMVTAVTTSAMALFLLIYKVVTYCREKNECLCGGHCTSCKPIATLCNYIANTIDDLGANGAGRTGWMWAFYVMITTVLMPIIYNDEDFTMAKHKPLVAPLCGIGFTCISLCWNTSRHKKNWLLGPVKNLLASLKRCCAKQKPIYEATVDDDETLLKLGSDA